MEQITYAEHGWSVTLKKQGQQWTIQVCKGLCAMWSVSDTELNARSEASRMIGESSGAQGCRWVHPVHA